MSRRLASLADLTYRRRGRVVIAWIVALVATIGIGSALAGEYNADYDTPGSESQAAGDLTKEKFDGYSGQEVYVVWKDEGGVATPEVKQRLDKFFASASQVEHISDHTPIRVSDDGTIATTTLPMTVPGWEMEKEQGEQLIAAAESNSGDGLDDQARRRCDLPGAGLVEPRGHRLPRRRDRAPDRVRLDRRRGAAARDRSGRARDLLGRADHAARERRRRPRLDHGRLRPDRDRGRDRLLAPRPHPLPQRAELGQGHARLDRRGGHDRRAQRDHRRRDRGDRGPRPLPDRPSVHVRGRALGLDRGAGRRGGRDHAPARAALLPRAARQQVAAADPRAQPRQGRRRAELARRPLGPRGPASPVDRGDRRHRGAARAGRAGARDAARVPRRRQRPERHDDPPGLRPDRRRLRPGRERAAGGRRRAPGRRGEGRHQPARVGHRPGRRRRLRQQAGDQPGRQRRAGDGHPDHLAAGPRHGGPRQPDARRDHPADDRRHRRPRRGRRRDRRARGPERVHEGPDAAVHRRRRRASRSCSCWSRSARR